MKRPSELVPCVAMLLLLLYTELLGHKMAQMTCKWRTYDMFIWKGIIAPWAVIYYPVFHQPAACPSACILRSAHSAGDDLLMYGLATQ